MDQSARERASFAGFDMPIRRPCTSLNYGKYALPKKGIPLNQKTYKKTKDYALFTESVLRPSPTG